MKATAMRLFRKLVRNWNSISSWLAQMPVAPETCPKNISTNFLASMKCLCPQTIRKTFRLLCFVISTTKSNLRLNSSPVKKGNPISASSFSRTEANKATQTLSASNSPLIFLSPIHFSKKQPLLTIRSSSGPLPLPTPK